MREEIKEILSEELNEMQNNASEKIYEEYKKNKEKYILDFLQAMDSLLKKCILLQEEQKLGAIKYIWINCMRASVETETYKYVLKGYDEKLYYDENEANEIYVSEYQKKLIKEDKLSLEKLVMKKVIRAKQYDVRDVQKWYEWNTYIKTMPREIEDAVVRIKELESFQNTKKDEDIKIYFGEMLEFHQKKYSIV
ncbi:MAG: hypothetical protein IJA34_04220 [Lachnospiraceae bacterium]|nr:hypothetical protein [Lachnospiraceae bacterium]